MSTNNITSVFLTLFLGFLGGVALYFLTMPLPWILGSLLMIGGLSLRGRLKLTIPLRIRQAMLAVLGVLLGSGFTPNATEHVSQWGYTLSSIPFLVLIQLFFAQILLFLIMRKYNFATRYFGGAAGGLLEMTLLARQNGGDDRAVMVLHTLRILLIVLFVPLYFRLFEGYTASNMSNISGGLIGLSLIDAGLLSAAALFGYYGGKFVRLPAYALMGPFILSAVFHAIGWTTAQTPYALVVLAQIVVGASLGTRFSGYSLRHIKKLFLKSIALSGLLLAIAAGFAFFLWQLTGIAYYALFLALVPGGMIEMSLIALALNIDVGFVTTHAIVRAFVVILIAPILYPILVKLRSTLGEK